MLNLYRFSTKYCIYQCLFHYFQIYLFIQSPLFAFSFEIKIIIAIQMKIRLEKAYEFDSSIFLQNTLKQCLRKLCMIAFHVLPNSMFFISIKAHLASTCSACPVWSDNKSLANGSTPSC